MIEIKHRFTGVVLHRHDGDNLAGANLAGAYLAGANLRGAYLAGANLTRAKVSPDHALIGTRPLMHIGPIGSRADMLYAYRTDKGLMLRAGCFFGTADEFAEAVRKTHGDSTHAADYMAALAFVRDWFARAK